MEIRSAALEDAATIVDLIKGLAEYEKLSHEVVVTEDKIKDTLFGEKKYAECLIAEIEQKPVGFALFFHSYSTFLGKPGLYLEDLFVKPEFRKQGVGKALLRRLAQIAVQRNCGRLEWSVLDWNKPAIDFYMDIGAKPMSEWTVFRLTEDEMKTFAKG
jgi:GNAT superfamily N-acetyltransferase